MTDYTPPPLINVFRAMAAEQAVDNLSIRESQYLQLAVERTLERDYYKKEAERLQRAVDDTQKAYFSRLNAFHRLLELSIEIMKEDCAPRQPSYEIEQLILTMERELANRLTLQ